MSFCGMNVTGGYFNETKEFQLFKNKKQVVSIIYGKNGSGKSSIARALLEKKKIIEGEFVSDLEFSNITLKEFQQHPNQGSKEMNEECFGQINIYAYNESFALENVHFKENGLDAIVMLGNQNNLQHQISKVEQKIATTEESLQQLGDVVKIYEDRKNPKSQINALDKIGEILRGRWAHSYSRITKSKINGRVDRNLIERLLIHKEDTKSYEELTKEFIDLLEDYEKIDSGQQQIEIIKPVSATVSLSMINSLLNKCIPEPNLSHRENAILSAIKASGSLLESKVLMQGEGKEDCPLCFQEISQEYKNTVLDIINKILQSSEANEHVADLEKVKIKSLSLNLESYREVINNEITQEIELLIDGYNEQIKKLSTLISNKINNPYIPLENMEDPEESLIEINKKLSICNNIVQEFNERVLNVNNVRNNLLDLNYELAYKDIKQFVEIYNTNVEEERKHRELLRYTASQLKVLKSEKEELKSKMANINIACETINAYLKYIFYDENRLRLHPKDGFYSIQSRGENIKLSSLSIGERNAISLCYFFSQLFKGKAIREVFSDKSILILDDPISSFDFKNKVGVYSFLRFILAEYHNANPESKAIFLTHDLEVFYHISKLYDDLNLSAANAYLINKELQLINTRNFNEYSELMSNIYDYALGFNRDVHELTIGNMMRRLLEAFSTFNYKVGIDSLSTNVEILSNLPTQEIIDYYKNSVYRLVLNSESHLAERTHGLIDRGYNEQNFASEEKVKTAKDLLILLYLLNPLHVKLHLKKAGEDESLLVERIKNIDNWKIEIFPRAGSLV